MRFSVVLSAIMATSALALPVVDRRTSLSGLDNTNSNIIALPHEKRQIDLSGVTGLVGDLTGTVGGLLDIVLNEVSTVESAVTAVVGDVESGNVIGALTTVEGTLTGLISQVTGILNGLTLDVSLPGVQIHLNQTIAAVETLVTDITDIVPTAETQGLITEVGSLAQQLLSILTGLLNSV